MPKTGTSQHDLCAILLSARRQFEQGTAMTTVNRTIPEATAQANRESHSVTSDIPDAATGITVRLTSSQWSTQVLAGKRVLWGVQLSYDGGATWGPGVCDNTHSNAIGGASATVPAWIYQTDTIGQFGKGGGLPFFGFSGDQITETAGAIARLFAWPEADIALGASITVTF